MTKAINTISANSNSNLSTHRQETDNKGVIHEKTKMLPKYLRITEKKIIHPQKQKVETNALQTPQVRQDQSKISSVDRSSNVSMIVESMDRRRATSNRAKAEDEYNRRRE